MIPKYVSTLPRLISPNPSTDPVQYCMIRDHFLDSTIAAYWGPRQPVAEPDDSATADMPVYHAPGDWPAAGTLLKVPRVVRFIWQTADLDASAIIVAGFSGTYIDSMHSTYYNYDNVFVSTTGGSGGIFPAHIHTVSTWPYATNPVTAYAIEFTDTIAGNNPTFGGTFEISGSYNNWYLPDFITPEFSLVDYRTAGSITASAINTAWLLLERGFTPAKPLPSPPDSLPEVAATITPDGPYTVGATTPILTGLYVVDGQQFGTDITLANGPITVPVGYQQPIDVDITLQPKNWTAVAKQITDFYKDSTDPWVDCFQKMPGALSWLDAVSPEVTTCFGTDSLHILVLCKPQDYSPDGQTWQLSQIVNCYKYMAGYRVIVFLDIQYMIDCNLPAAVISQTNSELQNFCDSMAAYGFTYGGPYNYPDAANMFATVQGLIAQYMPPEIPDSQSLVP